MATRRDNAGNFSGFCLGLDCSGAIVRKGRHAHQTHCLRKSWVTVTFEGSHLRGLIRAIAKASNKEVKS